MLFSLNYISILVVTCAVTCAVMCAVTCHNIVARSR